MNFAAMQFAETAGRTGGDGPEFKGCLSRAENQFPPV